MSILPLLCWECITKMNGTQHMYCSFRYIHLTHGLFRTCLINNFMRSYYIRQRQCMVSGISLSHVGVVTCQTVTNVFGHKLLPNSRTCLSQNVLHTSSYWVLPIGRPPLLEKGAKLVRSQECYGIPTNKVTIQNKTICMPLFTRTREQFAINRTCFGKWG